MRVATTMTEAGLVPAAQLARCDPVGTLFAAALGTGDHAASIFGFRFRGCRIAPRGRPPGKIGDRVLAERRRWAARGGGKLAIVRHPTVLIPGQKLYNVNCDRTFDPIVLIAPNGRLFCP
jgi:hypothetical protein